MTSPRVSTEMKPPEPPPEANQPTAIVWLKNNLFGSVASSIVSIVLGVAIFFMLRGALAFLFAEERLWEVIPRNATNYAIEGYPRADIARIWLSLFIVLFLTGVSMAVWKPTGRMTPDSLWASVRSIGTVMILVGVLAPETFGARMTVLILGAALVAVALLADRMLGLRAHEEMIPTLALVAGGAVALLAVLWVLPLERSTQIPYTIGLAVGVVGFGVGTLLTRRVARGPLRALVTLTWLISLPVIYLHIQRNPQIRWETVLGSWMPWMLGILVGGTLLIAVISRSDRERAGLINAFIVLAAAGIWMISSPMVARALLLLLAVISLATPTFGSSGVGRRNILLLWIGLAAFVAYIFVIGGARTGLQTRNEYYGGLNLTMMLAVGGLLLSFPLGVLLALGRTSTMPIFRLLSTGYIELVRGVPLITVLFIARFGILNFLPENLDFNPNILVLGGITLFSAAYLAENVRGGLQSIPRGQYEAAKALGLTTAQMTMLITLPQALRAVIPAIVGQVIALFKDTSLVAIVGLAEFFRVAREIVPNQPGSLGSIIENLLFAAAVYWIFTYNFSRASQRLERRLGVGTR